MRQIVARQTAERWVKKYRALGFEEQKLQTRACSVEESKGIASERKEKDTKTFHSTKGKRERQRERQNSKL